MTEAAPWQTPPAQKTRLNDVVTTTTEIGNKIRHEILIDPVAKPRQTQRDKWNPSKAVIKYRAYADKLRSTGLTIPEAGYHITFILPMPKSWAKSKRAAKDGGPHQQRPDKDNLEKAVLDALFKEDSHVWDGRATKIWGEVGKIIIEYEVQQWPQTNRMTSKSSSPSGTI